MNYTEFKNEILEGIRARLWDCEIEIRDVMKNNNVVLNGLCIKSAEINAAPTVYLEQFYESYIDGTDIEEIIDKIISMYDENKPESDYDFSYIDSYESTKNNIYFKAVNYERNKSFLEDVPYFRFIDLALVPYIMIDDELFGNASVVIHQDLFNRWGIDTDTFYWDVMNNMENNYKYDFVPISQLLKNMINKDDDCIEACSEMYVLCPSERVYGAALIAVSKVMAQIADKMDSDYYIIPSSIHELIMVSADDRNNEEYLNNMINEVNESVVSEEDYLSNHSYYYRRGYGITQ